jgi:hypothetical protein
MIDPTITIAEMRQTQGSMRSPALGDGAGADAAELMQ